MSIYKKLLQLQKQVKGVGKDKKSHNYDYVTGNKLMSFIRPMMDELGLILKQEVIDIENTRQDYKVWDKWAKNEQNQQVGAWKPKSETLSKVMMRFTWIDCETNEKDENLFGANGQNDWEKGLGSALTYGERYFLLKFFHIPTDQDDIDNPDRLKNNQYQKSTDDDANLASSKTKVAQKSSPKTYKECKTKAELKAFYNSQSENDKKSLKKLVSDFGLTLQK